MVEHSIRNRAVAGSNPAIGFSCNRCHWFEHTKILRSRLIGFALPCSGISEIFIILIKGVAIGVCKAIDSLQYSLPRCGFL